MLDTIRSFFTARLAPPRAGAPGGPEAGRPPAIHLAACALLLELAYADGEFTAAEQDHIEGALVRHFGLDADTAGELLELARAERHRSIDHFQFTRLIAEQYDLGQKMVLAEVMWGVILADGRLADHEAHLVRKMAHLLDLKPGYLAEARRAASTEGPGRGPAQGRPPEA